MGSASLRFWYADYNVDAISRVAARLGENVVEHSGGSYQVSSPSRIKSSTARLAIAAATGGQFCGKRLRARKVLYAAQKSEPLSKPEVT
jgi:hypothetical protein